MPSNMKLHEIYAERMMKRHDYGYPFYEPPSDAEVSPGKCGYIDSYGKWNPVADLTASEAELISLGLIPLSAKLQKAPRNKSIAWGPKYSDSVSGSQIEMKAGFSAESLGIPATASCVYQLSSKSDFGAVLMTEPNVWREGYYHDSPFESWVRQNSEILARLRPEIKVHGLFVVKWTYTTKKCSLNAWTNKDKVVTVGFQAKAVSIGEAAPHGNWYQASSDGGWIESAAVEKNERRVVFMGGLHFRWHRMASMGNHLKPSDARSGKPKWANFRSGEETSTQQVEIDNEDFEMECQRIGVVQDVGEDQEDENEAYIF